MIERTEASWLSALRGYLLFSGAGHLVWELLQLPLLGTGLAPFAQWLVVPVPAFWSAWRAAGPTAASATSPVRGERPR